MVLSRTGLVLALLAGSASLAGAQTAQPVDSLVDHFLRRGALSGWTPHELFKGCPDLQDWQQRGIQRLASADLSVERSDDLAQAWMIALRDCDDESLEQWFFDRVSRAIRSGEPEAQMLGFWTALSLADSPGIRAYLRDLMLDVDMPMTFRNLAGVTLFARLGPEESEREYLRAFETRRLPEEVAWGQTDRLLERNPEGFLSEVARLVSRDPALGDQTAFVQIVEASDRYVSQEARERLGQALQEGLDRPGGGVSGGARVRLENAALFLKRPR